MKPEIKMVKLAQKLMKLPPVKRAEVMAKAKLKRQHNSEVSGAVDEAQGVTSYIADEIWQPQHPKATDQQDLDNALSELGRMLTKGNRKHIMPVHETDLLPVLTQVMDCSFYLDLNKFKDSARFVLDTIRDRFGDTAADMITIDHLQGAYICIAGNYQHLGASTKKEVIAIQSLADLVDTFAQAGTATEMQTSKPAPSEMKHSNWVGQARAHWKEHQPKRFNELVSKGVLNQQLTDAAEATSQEMQKLVAQGFNQLEAWEMTRELYLFPGEEPGASEEAPVSEGLRLQRELNEGLRYLGMTDEEIAMEKALNE